MTDFVAAYFMLFMAVALMVIGFMFKHNWVLMLSGGFWVICGIYYLANAGGINFIYGLGWFCVAVSLPLFLSYLWHREKKEPTEIGDDTKSHSDRLYELTDKLYKARNRKRNIDL